MKILDITGLNYLVSKIKTMIGTKVGKTDIIDALTSTDPTKVLSAAQGKALNEKIGDITQLTTTDKSSTVAAINEVVANTSLSKQTVTQSGSGAVTVTVDVPVPSGYKSDGASWGYTHSGAGYIVPIHILYNATTLRFIFIGLTQQPIPTSASITVTAFFPKA